MITQYTLSELSQKLQSKEISAIEVTEAFQSRIEKEDHLYGAYLALAGEAALEQAKNAQNRIESGTAHPLTGVPIGIKDNISTLNLETTCASKILEGYIPPFNATVAEKLNEAGVISLGKLNLDEFAMGTTCENSAYKTTRNPWDTDLVPGGSSGGSAVAVSAELAPVSLGSDTGGSIRFPAALCGLVGFKPTYGRVSRYGLVAFGSSLDQIGPFARNVEDCALISNVISGHDPLDSTSLKDSQINISDIKSGSIKGLRIGLPKQLFTDEIEPGVREVVELALDQLRREGAETVELDLPSINYGVTTYYIIAPAEASSNLARFDGVRFGPRVQGDGHIDTFAETRGKLFGPEVKLRIMVGTYALSAGYFDAYYLRAQQVRGMMSEEFENAFKSVDVICNPTSPCVAFPIGSKKDPMALKALDYCTIPANMGGFPSISIPCGMSDDLPVGMLLTGPVNSDELLLQQAFTLESAFGRDYRRPPIL